MTNQLAPRPTAQQPFFQSLQNELERAIDRMRFNPKVHNPFEWIGHSEAGYPAIDMSETDDQLEITAEIPGVSEADLDISLNGDVLTIKGEKASDREEKEDNYHLTERRYGRFQRVIPLGFSPAEDAVKAAFDGGILKLTIHKPAEVAARVRKVPISKK